MKAKKMKALATIAILLGFSSLTFGQGSQSLVVVYQHTIRLNVVSSDGSSASAKMANQGVSQSKQVTLTYREGKSIFAPSKQLVANNPAKAENGGMTVMMSVPDEVTFKDFGEQKVVTQTDFYGKTFLIEHPMTDMGWKTTNEEKQIAGYSCLKATNAMGITIWYCPSIPVADGPSELCGAPGLILEAEGANGITTAISVGKASESTAITPPTEGAKVTPAQFGEIVRKRMEADGAQQGGLNIIIK